MNNSLYLIACLSLTACEKKFNPTDGAPQKPQVVETGDMSLVTVDQPNLFPLVTTEKIDAPDELVATGAVNPDVSMEQPVISLANGRVVDILARIGDQVRKGQLLLRVQSPDATAAFDTYIKADADEVFARKTLVRTQDLYLHGALPLSAVEQAEDTENDAKADLVASEDQLKTLGIDKAHPSSIVDVKSPISGVIVAQNVTNAAATGVSYAGNTGAFTVADLSHIWVICDVFENDIHKLAIGQEAKISLAAYPEKVLTGRISEVDALLDPNIRTAKVRIEVPNPGLLRLGMFVNATFYSKEQKAHPVVPASAVLHLHDREWVFIPNGGNSFKRVEVRGGRMLDHTRQEILSGINPEQQVVSNVLQLEATLEAKQ
ncbi:efflux RND transporter periplasmic adaptor subunit [Granulicella arctica]|uniref:Cobalt-zinc-cadmium efflux system membrane fusion protein n=1 Tax=Granulicella arctica TaxID=940613 RepID=A0A7Y9PK02_9BACT|nr:efflux RND transporter periplasmic adaptor subunit [Granulicella arctica]NYF81164.1 cobalt-zinc-cadmium efflux system membrane fusion protein [Granulicella arctica]